MPDIQPSILSIQVGKAAPLGPSGVLSGFVKRIVRGPVVIAPLGLTGDEQADLSVHGGPDKAVYFYRRNTTRRGRVSLPNVAGCSPQAALGRI
jgi:MOSC domain-containing protein YiiM